MPTTAKALKKTASDITGLVNNQARRSAALGFAVRPAIASSYIYPSTNTINLRPAPGSIRPARRNFHSGGAHPTRGFFSRFRSKTTEIPAAGVDTANLPATPSHPLVRDPRYLAHPIPVAWSTSICNTGEPIFLFDKSEEILPPAPVIPAALVPAPTIPAAPTKSKYPTAEELNLIFATAAWSTSLATCGDVYTHLWYLNKSDECDSPSAPISESNPTSTTMASDEDYSTFLDKASSDTKSARSVSAQSHTNKKQHTTVTTSSVPGPLKDIKATYTSDADEPFEPVSLTRNNNRALTADEVCELIGAKGGAVSEIGIKDFDPQGQYESVLQAVEGAVEGKSMKAFKVDMNGARCEYWVLGLAKDGGHVVGVKALAVES